MSDALGILAKAAFRKDRGLYGAGPAITYPDTPGGTDLAASHLVPFSSEGLAKALERGDDASLVGGGGANISSIVAEDSAGPLSGPLSWRGWERIIMCALGFEHPDDSPAFVGTPEVGFVVSDATNASPIVITSATHNYSTGDGVKISGVVGNTAANGNWVITVLSGTTFELDGSTGNGTYVSGGLAERYLAFAHLFEIDECLQDQVWDSAEIGGYSPPSANDMKVRRGMLGLAKQINDWVWQSVMVNKITISGTPKEVKISVDYIAYDYVKGSYNSGNWTLPLGSTAKCLFQQCVIKIGARSAGIGGLVEYSPSNYELVLDNKLKGDDRTTTSGVHIEQPDRGDKFDVDMKLEFPRYNASGESLVDLGETNIELAGSLEITGPQIAATGYNRLWGFYMSSLWHKDSASPVDKPGPLTHTANFRADKPGGSDIFDATKYHSITTVKDSPLVVIAQNDDSGNYLLET